MDETASKVPVTEEKAPERPTKSQTWRPFESLRREVDRLFEDFDRDLWRPLRRSAFDVEPFWRKIGSELIGVIRLDYVDSRSATPFQLTPASPIAQRNMADIVARARRL